VICDKPEGNKLLVVAAAAFQNVRVEYFVLLLNPHLCPASEWSFQEAPPGFTYEGGLSLGKAGSLNCNRELPVSAFESGSAMRIFAACPIQAGEGAFGESRLSQLGLTDYSTKRICVFTAPAEKEEWKQE
jgi:hypothetical protein